MDPTLFVGEVPDHFLCAICLYVVKEPIEHTECDKVFCSSCLQNCRNCPICRQSLQNKTRRMHRFAQDVYEKLQMRCKFEGCTVTFPWPKKDQHEETCLFTPKVECEHCHESIYEKALQSHWQESCTMFPVCCQVKCCKETVSRSRMDQHMQDFNARHMLMIEESYQTEILQLSRTVQEQFQSQQTLITAQQVTITRLESLVSSQRLAISRLEEKLGVKQGEDVTPTSAERSVAVIPSLPEPGPCITTLRGHRYDVNAVLVSEADHRLYSGSNDATIKVWNTLTYQCIATLEGHFANVRCLALSNGRKRLYSASEEILVWDIETLQTVHSLRGTANRAISYLLVEESGNRLFAACYDSTIIVWDLDSYQCVHTLQGHTERVECLCLSLFLSPPRLFSGSMDTCIRVWNTTTMRPVHNLQGHTGNVYSLCLSEDETRLYSGSNDKSIKVWDTVTNACLATLRGHTNTVFSLCLSLRTKQLISAGSSGQQIKIWDIETHRCVNTFEEAHENIIWSLALADNSGVIYSASKDKTIKAWKL